MAALKALCFILLLTLAAPALYINSTSSPTGAAGVNTVLSLQQLSSSAPAVDHATQATVFLIPVPEVSSTFRNITSALLPVTDIPSYPFIFSFPITNTSTSLAIPAPITVTVTKHDPLIIPMPATTITHSEVVTKTLTKVEQPSPIPVHQPSAPVTGHAKETWAAPIRYSNLSSFKVTKYPGPERNLKIVTGIPAQASAHPDSNFAKTGSKKSKKTKGNASTTGHFGSLGWDNNTAAIQIFYPKGSINPAREPQGGAEFYGSPIDISDARSVTFEYSVFFPADFDWVKAGKLPGLYGGHPGCSGGNAALDCFSTRLMWRKDGQGELYLVKFIIIEVERRKLISHVETPPQYAPKDKQTKALCDDPLSTCDAAYGLSIGRGSFEWAAGAWTTARQTIILNTPGKTDGVFALDVNGERVIDRNDVMYRDRIPPSKTATKKPSKATKTTTSSASSSTDGDGLLGPIVSGVLGGLGIEDVGNSKSGKGGKGKSKKGKREDRAGYSMPTSLPRQGFTSRIAVPGPGVTKESPIQTRDVQGIRRGAKAEANNGGDDGDDDDGQVKLVGIFFSTFFGGHEDEYATPKDQYAWFKDFKLSYNN